MKQDTAAEIKGSFQARASDVRSDADKFKMRVSGEGKPFTGDQSPANLNAKNAVFLSSDAKVILRNIEAKLDVCYNYVLQQHQKEIEEAGGGRGRELVSKKVGANERSVKIVFRDHASRANFVVEELVKGRFDYAFDSGKDVLISPAVLERLEAAARAAHGFEEISRVEGLTSSASVHLDQSENLRAWDRFMDLA